MINPLNNPIARRYLVVNSFDGILTVLGIIFAGFFAGITEARYIILPSIGSIIALFVSGIWSAYSAESSEAVYRTKEIKRHLLADEMSDAVLKRRRGEVMTVAFVNGLSPAVSAAIVLLPFLASAAGLLSFDAAYYISFAVAASLLFALGAFTGYVAHESMIKKGLVMIVAAIAIAGVFYLLAAFSLL